MLAECADAQGTVAAAAAVSTAIETGAASGTVIAAATAAAAGFQQPSRHARLRSL